MGLKEWLSGGDPAPPGVGGDQGPADLAQIKANAQAARRTRRQTRKSLLQDEDEALKLQADIDALFEKENWEELAALYFNARFAMTGDKDFLLNDKQKAVLSTTMAATMKVLLRIDPAYIAMVIFLVNFSTFVVDKEIHHRQKPKP